MLNRWPVLDYGPKQSSKTLKTAVCIFHRNLSNIKNVTNNFFFAIASCTNMNLICLLFQICDIISEIRIKCMMLDLLYCLLKLIPRTIENFISPGVLFWNHTCRQYWYQSTICNPLMKRHICATDKKYWHCATLRIIGFAIFHIWELKKQAVKHTLDCHKHTLIHSESS